MEFDPISVHAQAVLTHTLQRRTHHSLHHSRSHLFDWMFHCGVRAVLAALVLALLYSAKTRGCTH